MKISLSHGSGGKLMHELICNFLNKFDNKILKNLSDAGVIELNDKIKLAFTTDSYVVNPLFFGNNDIGKLSVCGTINDLSVMGAKPLYISLSYIIEEGLPIETLDRITNSIAETAKLNNVLVVTGDTKVVDKGKCDGIFITTSGIGIQYYDVPKKIEVGDKIIINGGIGEHEISILCARKELNISSNVESDCNSLYDLIYSICQVSDKIKFMRDPTRGGLATTLNEIVKKDFGIIIYEENIPIKEEVKGICSLLGFDPLYLANEGKVVVIVSSIDAEIVLSTMRSHPKGKSAKIIGEIVDNPKGLVCLKTISCGTRIVDMPITTQLPRIC